jgi:hypothetical protein
MGCGLFCLATWFDPRIDLPERGAPHPPLSLVTPNYPQRLGIIHRKRAVIHRSDVPIVGFRTAVPPYLGALWDFGQRSSGVEESVDLWKTLGKCTERLEDGAQQKQTQSG